MKTVTLYFNDGYVMKDFLIKFNEMKRYSGYVGPEVIKDIHIPSKKIYGEDPHIVFYSLPLESITLFDSKTYSEMNEWEMDYNTEWGYSEF